MNRVFLLTCLLSIFTSSCNDAGTSPVQRSLGTFNYTAYDTLGHVTARGILALQVDSTRVTGDWQFENDGSGELVGQQKGDTVSLNLNPRFVDNNLFLVGKLSGNTYSGIWQYVGFPGVINWGTFLATRK